MNTSRFNIFETEDKLDMCPKLDRQRICLADGRTDIVLVQPGDSPLVFLTFHIQILMTCAANKNFVLMKLLILPEVAVDVSRRDRVTIDVIVCINSPRDTTGNGPAPLTTGRARITRHLNLNSLDRNSFGAQRGPTFAVTWKWCSIGLGRLA